MGRYFGTDGVRGEANKVLTAEMAYRIGQYLGSYFNKNGKGRILIGKDTRLSSDMFESALSCGITEMGGDAYLLGFTTTPCLACLVAHEDFDCGVMISASHNPYYDNGIKIFGTDGLKIKDDMEAPIEDYMDHLFELEKAQRDNIGHIYNYQEGVNHYVDWICEKYPSDLSSLNILLDLCNGGASFTARKIFEKLHANITVINEEPNGTNINFGCGSTHLESLKEGISKGHYDIGFAFDGDADRVLALDAQGVLIDGDKIIYILACYLKSLDALKGNSVVATVMSNIGLKKALDRASIGYDIVSVGDKNVVEDMRLKDYMIGGEQSGHIINSYSGYFGDGVKTALNVLEVMLVKNKSIDELCSDVIIYPQELLNIKVVDKNVVLKDIDINNKIAEIEKLLASNGRILVRPSGTEPLIRVMTEAENLELCHKYNQEVIDLIKEKGYAA